jgi:hypothetical protein
VPDVNGIEGAEEKADFHGCYFQRAKLGEDPGSFSKHFI